MFKFVKQFSILEGEFALNAICMSTFISGLSNQKDLKGVTKKKNYLNLFHLRICFKEGKKSYDFRARVLCKH